MGCACGALPNQGCACNALPSACASDPCIGDPCAPVPQLTPEQAKTSIAARIAASINRSRLSMQRMGFRPYNVDLVWITWTGRERGAGFEKPLKRTHLTPSPIVTDLTSIAMSVVATGVLPVGSVRLDKVSTCFTSDELLGRIGENGPPEPIDFYYEIYEDGRNGASERMKFRPSSQPHRKKYGWTITLERMSGDAERDGTPAEVKP